MQDFITSLALRMTGSATKYVYSEFHKDNFEVKMIIIIKNVQAVPLLY